MLVFQMFCIKRNMIVGLGIAYVVNVYHDCRKIKF